MKSRNHRTTAPEANSSNGAGTKSMQKLKRKRYEKELAHLHVEPVKLQQWVARSLGQKPR